MTREPTGKIDEPLSLLDLIVETAPDAIVTIDTEGAILSFSPAAERIFGFEAAEVVGRDVACLMPEPFASHHAGCMRRYLETGEKRIIGIGRQVRGRRKDGTVFDMELAVGEHEGPRHRIFAGFIRDVSDRVAASRELALLRRRLEQVSRSKMLGELSTALAHEINQPLSAVANFAAAAERALTREPPDAKMAAGLLRRIVEQSTRAGEIVRRMRRLVETGTVEKRPEDINALVREALHVSQFDAIHDGLEIVLDLEPCLPPVLADRVQIEQILINLLANAAEAMAGNTHPEIHVLTALRRVEGRVRFRAATNRKGEVEVSVEDNGPGFPPELGGRAFEPFATTKAGGMGVGLAICRSIVEAHGGRIWIEPTLDGGAAVRFTLPLAEPA